MSSVDAISTAYQQRRASQALSPSYLLNTREADLVEIFVICGFYNDKKGLFLLAAFRTWIAATFEAGTVEVTIVRKTPIIKIGLGNHPRWPVNQVKEKLNPPRFLRMQTAAGGQGKSIKDSFMQLFNKRSQTLASMTAATMTNTTTTDTTTPTTTAAAAASPLRVPYSPVKLSQSFNISTSPAKPKLAMELVSEMDTPQKAPLMRKFVKGSTITIETLNNSQKNLDMFHNAQMNRL
jgi:hypothetical protein